MRELLDLAKSVGWGAADILQRLQMNDLNVQGAGNTLVTVADTSANNYIVGRLQTELGTQEFGYLSEETYKINPDSDRLSKHRVWIIDPLDGTWDYVHKTGEYAVHIALVEHGRPVLAIVVCPAVYKLYYATRGGGTYVESRYGTEISPSQRLKVSDKEQLNTFCLVISRNHREPRLNYLLQQLPCQNQRYVGSIGGKIAALVEQKADAYIALSGKSAPKDWDLAAPELVLTEAGGMFTFFDGSIPRYNKADVNQWGGYLASNGRYHTELCARAQAILDRFDAQDAEIRRSII
ncbi:MAG: 3'(2'),5'-bisphosphate nucleotidase CysQ [Cyanobacteria bacterium]|nr:3'(2'),5'-bisphosphate nucleotidase CysQ [Cyanobacteriota bacterium]